MFSLLDLCFGLWTSLYLHVLRTQRIIGFFNRNYPQINQVGNPITSLLIPPWYSILFIVIDPSLVQYIIHWVTSISVPGE